MTDIPDEEVASRPVGMAVLLGLLTGCFSHELILSFAPEYLWFSVAAFIPGFYLVTNLDQEQVEVDECGLSLMI